MKFLSRKTCLILIYITSSVFCFVQCNGQKLDEDYQPECVSRRSSQDIVYQNQDKNFRCIFDTYMIEENRCIKNDNFFEECRYFALTPKGKPTAKRLAIYFDQGNLSVTYINSTETAAVSSIIVNNSNAQHVNGSLCEIASLEVYRGKTQTTEISHVGFVLSNKGTFEMNQNQLAYSFDEYKGELYRMNLTCSGESLPNRGCLFFKVIGKTNVTEPKFNCTIPGTLYKYSAECLLPEKIFYPNPSKLPIPPGQVTTNSPGIEIISNNSGPHLTVGGSLLYALVGAGGGGCTMLSLCSFCICTLIVFRRKQMKVSTIISTEMERRISTASKLTETSNGKDVDLHIYETPGDILQSKVYGCNCLENNPAYLKPRSTSSKAEQVLECNYAVIPTDHHDPEPVYQQLIPQSRTRPRSGLDSIITAENTFYDTSLNLKHQWKECDLPDNTRGCRKVIPDL